MMTGHLVCLCAAWCRLCDGYATTIEAVAAEFTGLALRWIDIEDEAELVGEIDIETFPTIVIIDADGNARFAGPVTPQPDTLRRLLRASLGSSARAGPEWQALAARLQGVQ